MSGFGAREFNIVLLTLISLALWLYKKQTPEERKGLTREKRKCLACGHISHMPTWCRASWLPNVIIIVGLLCYLIPGILFMMYAWGRYKCTNCGAVGKNAPTDDIIIFKPPEKTCPYCAETIKLEAIVCKYCGRAI